MVLKCTHIHNPMLCHSPRVSLSSSGVTQLTAQHNQTLEILTSIISKTSDQEKKFMKVDGG